MVNIRAACLAAAVLALSATAAPTPNAYPTSLSRRQDAQTPRTIQTQDVTKVSGGTIVRDCTVVFEDLDPNSVRKTERCTEMFVPNGQPLPPPPSNTAQPPVASPDPAPPTSAPSPTDTTTAPADTTTPPADPAPTSAPTEGGNDPQQPVDTNSPPAGEPTENPDAPGNDQPTQPAGGEQGSTGGDGAPTDLPAGGVVTSSDGAAGPSPTDPSQGSSTVTGTRAGAEASQSSGQVNVPGKSVEVLPIGLGVFAGISVIALIVVGLTTYERTKYRKAFRARRLAAGGAEMGYGGMSERR